MSVAGRLAAAVAAGRLLPDPNQALVAARLDAVLGRVARRTRARALAPARLVPWLAPARGLYLHGDVGTGKTMLMDAAHPRGAVAETGRRAESHGPEVRASDITPRREECLRHPSAG